MFLFLGGLLGNLSNALPTILGSGLSTGLQIFDRIEARKMQKRAMRSMTGTAPAPPSMVMPAAGVVAGPAARIGIQAAKKAGQLVGAGALFGAGEVAVQSALSGGGSVPARGPSAGPSTGGPAGGVLPSVQRERYAINPQTGTLQLVEALEQQGIPTQGKQLWRINAQGRFVKVKRRSMNPLNPQAAKRSMRRISKLEDTINRMFKIQNCGPVKTRCKVRAKKRTKKGRFC